MTVLAAMVFWVIVTQVRTVMFVCDNLFNSFNLLSNDSNDCLCKEVIFVVIANAYNISGQGGGRGVFFFFFALFCVRLFGWLCCCCFVFCSNACYCGSCFASLVFQ